MIECEICRSEIEPKTMVPMREFDPLGGYLDHWVCAECSDQMHQIRS
jgi:hypothetical protein